MRRDESRNSKKQASFLHNPSVLVVIVEPIVPSDVKWFVLFFNIMLWQMELVVELSTFTIAYLHKLIFMLCHRAFSLFINSLVIQLYPWWWGNQILKRPSWSHYLAIPFKKYKLFPTNFLLKLKFWSSIYLEFLIHFRWNLWTLLYTKLFFDSVQIWEEDNNAAIHWNFGIRRCDFNIYS